MVAAAYKATLCFASAARRWSVRATVSDVNGEYFLFPSGASDYQLPAGEGNVMLTDIILSAAGTDTSQSDIYVNDNTIGIQIANAANVGTVFNRQFMSVPLTFKGGARLRFKQLT